MRQVRATRPARKTPPPAPVIITRPHPLVWETALRAAEGDARRIAIEPDGSVIVHNRPVART